MTKTIEQLKIAIICPWFYQGDAVGQNAYDYYLAFKALGYENVRGLGTRNDFSDMEFDFCEDLEQLEANAWFRSADILVYHYAIYHEYFNAIARDGKRGKHVICFHNVTPKHLMPLHAWNIIDQSFAQMQIFHHADAIWADSRENLEELERQGIKGVPVQELPIVVERPQLSHFSDKNPNKIELICVGRFFSSKGLLDVVQAMSIVKKDNTQRLILRLVGNTDFSDAKYVELIKKRIIELGLGEYIDFVGKVDEPTLARLFRQAHIYLSASYHEGFCVPVIEALRSGCIPVTYDAGNLRWISGGYGVTVSTGDIKALAKALNSTIKGIYMALNNKELECLKLDSDHFNATRFTEASKQYALSFDTSAFRFRLSIAINNLFGN